MTTTSTLNSNPIEKLTQLCAQRTVRTDRLHSAVRALTDALEAAGARPGEISATVDSWTLSYNNVRSNVGVRDCWSLTGGAMWRVGVGYADCTDLSLPPDAPGTGPSRAHLIAFGQRAARFVDAIVANLTREVATLDTAIEQVDAATAKL